MLETACVVVAAVVGAGAFAVTVRRGITADHAALRYAAGALGRPDFQPVDVGTGPTLGGIAAALNAAQDRIVGLTVLERRMSRGQRETVASAALDLHARIAHLRTDLAALEAEADGSPDPTRLVSRYARISADAAGLSGRMDNLLLLACQSLDHPLYGCESGPPGSSRQPPAESAVRPL